MYSCDLEPQECELHIGIGTGPFVSSLLQPRNSCHSGLEASVVRKWAWFQGKVGMVQIYLMPSNLQHLPTPMLHTIIIM